MKRNLLYIGMASLLVGGIATSCESGTNEFDNFDYSTVYFANQFAERTLELGEDEFVDNSMDNEHKVSIKAAWGGGYTNPQNVTIDFEVDESLCDGVYFKGTDTQVVPMPENYYTLASNQINIPAGQITGGVEVQLTDAFFADPKTTSSCYAIPLRMIHVEGADSILQGKTEMEDPLLTDVNDWTIQPKQYVLYVIKYVNVWHGEYLRRGIDKITSNGSTTSAVRHEQYIEDDEVVYVKTNSLTQSNLALTAKDDAGKNINYNVTLDFNEDGTCTLTSATDGVDVKGEGHFLKDGEKNSLGGKDRDALYLKYNVNLTSINKQYDIIDTLVLRTRGVQGGKAFDVDIK